MLATLPVQFHFTGQSQKSGQKTESVLQVFCLDKDVRVEDVVDDAVAHSVDGEVRQKSPILAINRRRRGKPGFGFVKYSTNRLSLLLILPTVANYGTNPKQFSRKL